MTERLAGHSAIVTGATRGLGRAIASALAAAGAAAGRHAVAVRADLTDRDDIDQLVDAARNILGLGGTSRLGFLARAAPALLTQCVRAHRPQRRRQRAVETDPDPGPGQLRQRIR